MRQRIAPNTIKSSAGPCRGLRNAGGRGLVGAGMKLAIIGASGWLGGTIAREAIARGHDVTAVGRDATRLSQIEGAHSVVADLDDPDSLVAAIGGSDVVVAAVTD